MTKKVEDILAGLDGTSLSEALKAMTKSPLLTAMEQSRQSPAFQITDLFQNSAALKAMEVFQTSPTFKATEALWESQAIKDATHLASLADMGGLARLIDEASTVDSALPEVWKNLEWSKEEAFTLADVGLSDLLRIKEAQTIPATRGFHSSVFDVLSAPLSALARTNQWASSLSGTPWSKLATLYPGLAQPSALNDILKAAQAITEATGGGVVGGALGLSAKLDAGFADTSLKLSALVGASDVHGIDAGITAAAYRNLFGEWRTRPDLPERFWRDPKYRHDMYREAQVDEGLIEADVGTTLDIMIGGGLAGGFRKDGGSVAFLTYGSLTLCIRSDNLRADAYRVVGKFEETMRAFIMAKLQAKADIKWFTQRVDGKVVEKARGAREAAVKRDEAPMPLISYTDLGELAGIILRGNNWSEVFEDVFINKSEFDHDMQRLVALRRPTAHHRKVDGPRLMEAMCVMDRLDRRMKQNGGWKAALESDE